MFRGALLMTRAAAAAAVARRGAAAASASAGGAVRARLLRGALAAAAGLAGGAAVAAAAAAPAWDEKAVRADIAAALRQREAMGPTLVRLAWHASGTYDAASNTGGSDGATMRFAPESGDGANAGLGAARAFLEPVKARHPALTYADLWTLAGVVAIEEMGGPAVQWRAGRGDAASGAACPPVGRLPDADKGSRDATIAHIRRVFYRMGFSDREIVALAGAHALGRCNRGNSGYDGPWTRAPTSFSNDYFRELLENDWKLRQWDGPQQYADPTGELMMLPADMAFVWDPEFKRWAEAYARDEELFFRDFADAFQKLEELGVPALHSKPFLAQLWSMLGGK